MTGRVEFASVPSPESQFVDLDEARGGGLASEQFQTPYPEPILRVSEDALREFKLWLDNWLTKLISEQQRKQEVWQKEEEAYRAVSEGPRTFPFVGACGDVVPLIAMAVDPIFARLDVGLFKQDKIFRLRPLKKRIITAVESLERWVDYYVRNVLRLRQVFQPRLLELCKHGTTVFKTVYDNDSYTIQTYDRQWNVVEREVTRFRGPRVFGISIKDFLFPAGYQDVQQCPIVFERQRVTFDQLKIAEASKKLANVDKVSGRETSERTALELEREESAKHSESGFDPNRITIWECWCDYDINGDGLPERMVCTYHRDTGTILQLRYNWYFHQRKPYTVIPYQVVNDSLYGMGLCEMILPFQESLTQWHRMAVDNAYLANIRAFVVKKDSGIEDPVKLYTGRRIAVDDPSRDFIGFSVADIYRSTLIEQQNIIGLVEKRTGVSDYLTGRESPIVGTRATATSTLALIREGTQRVEEVMENIRVGCAEILQNCIHIWIQYGLDGLDDVVFGDDEMVTHLKDFFDQATEESVSGAVAVDIAATDAANNRTVQQQMRLAIIQVMMQYLQRLIEASQLAFQSMGTVPAMADVVSESMKSARKMFRDLLVTYDIPNPDDYLPDLEQFLNAARQQSPGAVGRPAQPPPGVGQPLGLSVIPGEGVQPVQPDTSLAGVGRNVIRAIEAAGGGAGV